LCDVILLLMLFQLGEHVSVSLLHILHLPQHYQLFLVNDVLGVISKVIVFLGLFLLEALAALVLLAV